MNRGKIAIKLFLKNSIRESFGNKMSATLIMFMTFALVILVSIPISMFVLSSYDGLKSINQEENIIYIILLMGSLITIFMGIYTILNTFFFSNDVEVLLPLPFRLKEIMFGKFAVTLINVYIYTLIIVIPLITYGVISNKGVIYYIFLVVVVLVNPILPLIFGLLTSLIIMRFTSISKYKDMFKTIAGVISIILVLGINFFLNINNGVEFKVEELVLKSNKFIDLANNIFFTNIFGGKSLYYGDLSNGILNIGILIVLTIVLLGILFFIGEKLYFKSVIGMNETFSKKENILEDGNKHIKVKSQLMTLAIRDVKLVLRTPDFFMNCIVLIIYFPMLFIIVFFSKWNSVDISEISGIIILGATILAMAPTIGGSGASLTALSREGNLVIVSKYIPVNYKIQIKSKILSSIIINSIALIIGFFILIYLKVDTHIFLMSAILQIMTIITVSIIGVCVDYYFPRLHWENSKAVFEKSFKPLVMDLILIVVGGLLFLMTFFIGNVFVIFLIHLSILLLGSIISYTILMKYGPKVYKKY